jgi:predicted PurR-regulated permease PerM
MAQQVATTDAQERAAAAWRTLAGRLRTVTPSGIGRIVVVAATVVGAAWLLGATWPAIVPFLAGGVLAYAVLPIVDRLDRFMPRVLAGLLAVAAVVVAVVAFLAVVGPPIVAQLVKIFLDLPSGERLGDLGLRVREWLATLPEGSQALATEVIDRVVAILRADISGALDGLAAFIADSIVHAFDALSVLLGLLVIPTWILAVTNDTPEARRRLARHVAPWLRPDLLALARIADAVASAFLRVQILASVGTGFGVWLALYALGRAGVVPEAPYIAVAAIAGAAQLIPQVGTVLGALPAVILLATQPPELAVAFLVAYLVVVKLVGMLVGTRLAGPALRVHPAILIPGVVVASQIGLIPLLVAGPVIAIGVHSIQYLYGRFAEPARPAGLMPWEPPPAPTAAAVAAAPARRVPLVYRRAAAIAAARSAAAAAPITSTAVLPSATSAPSATATPSATTVAATVAASLPSPEESDQNG